MLLILNCFKGGKFFSPFLCFMTDYFLFLYWDFTFGAFVVELVMLAKLFALPIKIWKVKTGLDGAYSMEAVVDLPLNCNKWQFFFVFGCQKVKWWNVFNNYLTVENEMLKLDTRRIIKWVGYLGWTWEKCEYTWKLSDGDHQQIFPVLCMKLKWPIEVIRIWNIDTFSLWLFWNDYYLAIHYWFTTFTYLTLKVLKSSFIWSASTIFH